MEEMIELPKEFNRMMNLFKEIETAIKSGKTAENIRLDKLSKKLEDAISDIVYYYHYNQRQKVVHINKEDIGSDNILLAMGFTTNRIASNFHKYKKQIPSWDDNTATLILQTLAIVPLMYNRNTDKFEAGRLDGHKIKEDLPIDDETLDIMTSCLNTEVSKINKKIKNL